MSGIRKSVLSESVRRLSQWIDDSYPDDMPEELVLRRRTGKLMEEAGEVASALGGYTGENPRKGVTHSRDDVMAELLDVAVTALGAWEHMDGNRGHAFFALTLKLDAILLRANLGPEPGSMLRQGVALRLSASEEPA
jgi:NTP pyrophosphatase (non-canonical NTP hydrolase)